MNISDEIIAAAQREGIDPPHIALEVARRESGLNQNARGTSGEIGLFQLMPSTAADLGVDPTDIEQNIAGGVSYLHTQLMRFGDLAGGLAAFNAGPGAVARAQAQYGENWLDYLPSSTQAYVHDITAAVGSYTAQLNIPGGIKQTKEIAQQMLADPEVVRQLAWILALTAGAWLLLQWVTREA